MQLWIYRWKEAKQRSKGSLLDNVVILLCLVQNIAAFGKNFALAILSFCGLGVVETTKRYFGKYEHISPRVPGAHYLHQQLLKDEFVSYLTLCLYDL